MRCGRPLSTTTNTERPVNHAAIRQNDKASTKPDSGRIPNGQAAEDRTQALRKIVEYFPAKRFGFIRPYYGPDVFFHITMLRARRRAADQAGPTGEVRTGARHRTDVAAATLRSERREDSRTRPAHPQRQLVELIDKIPGAVLDDTTLPVPRHPRARRKKPNWRR